MYESMRNHFENYGFMTLEAKIYNEGYVCGLETGHKITEQECELLKAQIGRVYSHSWELVEMESRKIQGQIEETLGKVRHGEIELAEQEDGTVIARRQNCRGRRGNHGPAGTDRPGSGGSL